MELLNATKMATGYTQGLDPEGHEFLVVAIKGTFTLPLDGGEPQLADEQVPLVEADTFSGEPGFSAPIYESDYCPKKPFCDVLVNGSAYSPNGQPAATVRVGLRVGPINKVFDVVGDRLFNGAGGAPGKPQPFAVMPISYDRAFGGIDDSDPEKARACDQNIAGVGFHPLKSTEQIRELPAPNTQEVDKPINGIDGDYRPMAFGPIGRSWAPRPAFAGTYDDNWLEEVFPFLPPDFDDRYFQSAPTDQVMPHPRGGEEVTLWGLTPQGKTVFRLPMIDLPVEYTNVHFERQRVEPAVDTVIIEPDLHRFMLVWRTSFPLKRNMLEAQQLVVGKMTRGWYRARELGKTYIGKGGNA